jgi:hypothetical protein
MSIIDCHAPVIKPTRPNPQSRPFGEGLFDPHCGLARWDRPAMDGDRGHRDPRAVRRRPDPRA